MINQAFFLSQVSVLSAQGMANKIFFVDTNAVIVYSNHMSKIKFTSKADKFKWGTRAKKRAAEQLELKMKQDREQYIQATKPAKELKK